MFGSEVVDIIPTFEELNLQEDLLRGIYAYGLQEPLSTQQRAIKPATSGKDVIMQAQSGTGKTTALSISILQSIDTSVLETQALVLSPMRVAATQIQALIMALGDYMNVQCHACIGGTSIRDDIRKLDHGAHVVSGTPGRVYDMIRRRNLCTKTIKIFVLDEADELLNGGFKDQIFDIYRHLPPATQVISLSATLPVDVLQMVTKFMVNPIKILVRRDELTLEGIKQFWVDVVKEDWKFGNLCDLYETLTMTRAVVFCNTKRKHGDKPPKENDEIIQEFRDTPSCTLITTDGWARNTEFQNVTQVVNYDLPFGPENYLRRVGPLGHTSSKGVAINLVTNWDKKALVDIAQHYSTRIDELLVNGAKVR